MLVRRAFLGLGEAALDAAIAGLVLGLVETVVVAQRAAPRVAELPSVFAATTGFALVAVMVLGTPLVLALRLLLRHPALVAVGAALRAPGPRRVEVITTIATVLAALTAAWWVSVHVTAHAHLHRKLPEGAGMLVATATFAAIAAALFVASLVGPAVGRLLGRRAVAVRVARGWPSAALGGGAALALAATVDHVVTTTIPSWDPVPAYVQGVAVALVALVAVTRPARRLRRSMAVVVASATAAAVACAPVLLGVHDPARGAVLGRGVIARSVVNTIAGAFDGDGDGYADELGMFDCDDDDARVHPGAVERVGNGRDDDCMGGDAAPGTVAVARGVRSSSTPGAARHDVILVTIDSLRADHTSLHDPAIATPALAALAARGTVFEQAHCASPTTRFALPALLFGRHPHTLPFGGGRSWPVLGPHALPTLATELRAAGYRTAAIMPRVGMPLSASTFAGFDEVVTIEHERPERNIANGPVVVARARAWLATPSTAPRLLWLHLMEPHYPYEPTYAEEIRAADRVVDELVGALDASRTVVVVTADHGEAFFEHAQRFHGTSLYDEETRVPLVIAVPGGAGWRIEALVSHVDLAPTLLDLVGVATPAGMTGDSLARAVRSGEEPAARGVVTAVLPGPQTPRRLVAVHAGDDVLIRDLDAWTVEAYDLARDPRQDAPVRSGPTVARLVRELERVVTRDLAVP